MNRLLETDVAPRTAAPAVLLNDNEWFMIAVVADAMIGYSPNIAA